jgi:hypothetical protein
MPEAFHVPDLVNLAFADAMASTLYKLSLMLIQARQGNCQPNDKYNNTSQIPRRQWDGTLYEPGNGIETG